MSSSLRTRVILVDDHNLMRAGLKSLLEKDIAVVVGEAPNAQEALEACCSIEHDVLVLDLHLPGQDGLWLLERLRENGWDKKALVVSMQTHHQLVLSALRAGAHGYLTKTAEPAEFYAAIQEILRGGNYVEPRLAGRLLRQTPTMDTSGVTPREREILSLLPQGYSNTKIAESLSLSEATVKTHLNNLFRKLGVASRGDAISAGIQLGLVGQAPEELA